MMTSRNLIQCCFVGLSIWLLANDARRVCADEVLDWNKIMQSTVAVAPTNANFQARWGAIVQLSVFEAVNAIHADYEPYLGITDAPPEASVQAAVVAAAHRALVVLRPGSANELDIARDQSLAAIPDGPEKDEGILVGIAAADSILLLRADDGAAAASSVPYTPGIGPGAWQPVPPTYAAASLPGWGLVRPFALESGPQFRSPAPPQLHTDAYANDLNEVKRLGRIDSAFRPQDRTDVARFFAAASPIQVWNQAARQASTAHGMTLEENSRIFALLALAIVDASIAAYDTKYHYNFWRPLTAIRTAESDGNIRTIADSGWSPLLTTPAFPSYASAHATLSGAAREILEDEFGKNGLAIVLTNPQLPDVDLEYSQWKQITDDIDDARIYGGIHFRFEQKAGAKQGRQVGKYVRGNCLRR